MPNRKPQSTPSQIADKSRRSSILALDPGTKNFAWSFIRLTGRTVSVPASGMFPKDVLNAVSVDVLDDWTTVFLGMLGKLPERPDAVVWERYQTRKVGSKNNETINLGLGVVHACCMRDGLKVLDPVMPATWKNAWNRAFGTSKEAPWQDYAKGLLGRSTVHQRDSVGLGVYTIDKLFEVELIRGLAERR